MSNLSVIQQDIEQSLIAAGVSSVLPESISMKKFVQCAAIAIASNKDLANADRDSMIMSLTNCAKDGLVPDNKEAAIVTFNTNIAPNGQPKQWITKAQYMPMIDGVMKRARMSGQISLLSSKAVYAGDEFDYWMDENGEHINYRPKFGGGEVSLAFAFAKLTTGELIVEVMSRADIDRVKAASKTGTSGPWKNWLDRMACKAVMHRLARRLPNASEIIEMCERGMNMDFDARTEKEILPEVENPIEKLKALLDGKEPEKYLPWLGVEKLEDITPEHASAAVLKLENAKQ